jgi:hypothetical protein
LSFDCDRLVDLIEGVFANGTVMTEVLDVQQASVGSKADLPQGGQVHQSFADAEVARVVDPSAALRTVSVRRERPSL